MVHSTERNAPYIHPSHDSILKLWRTLRNAENCRLVGKTSTQTNKQFLENNDILFHMLNFPSFRLKKLLHQVEVDFEETCYLTEGVDQCQPTYSNIPWTDVISICIDIICMFLSSTKIFEASQTNSADPDQTAPTGAA